MGEGYAKILELLSAGAFSEEEQLALENFITEHEELQLQIQRLLITTREVITAVESTKTKLEDLTKGQLQ